MRSASLLSIPIYRTLLSGNPVTFRQALFESYYVKRPSVPVEVAGRILPLPDRGVIAAETAARDAAAPLPAPLQKSLAARSAGEAMPALPPSASTPAQIEPAQAAESVTQTAFTLPYRVSVAAGQSLAVPILDRELPAQHIDLYQPAADQRHPLAAAALVNDGETGLPPGVLTLLRIGEQRRVCRNTGDLRSNQRVRVETKCCSSSLAASTSPPAFAMVVERAVIVASVSPSLSRVCL